METLTAPINAAEAQRRGLLDGRQARCECGRTCPSAGPAPGFNEVPFFEYRGPGSQHAIEGCRCGYYRVAHRPEIRARNNYVCESFEPRGPHEFDSFYCGCRGWD